MISLSISFRTNFNFKVYRRIQCSTDMDFDCTMVGLGVLSYFISMWLIADINFTHNGL